MRKSCSDLFLRDSLTFVKIIIDHFQELLIYFLFRVVKTTLSSSYNISGLVPVCWLLFHCF